MATKGSGHLFKRNGIYYIRFMVNGKTITKTLKTPNKKEAEEKAKELSKIVKANTTEEIAVHVKKAKEIMKEEKNKTPILESWNAYLKNPNRPDSGEVTLKSYKTSWNSFVESLPSTVKYLEDVTTTEVKYFMSTLNSKSNRTYNARLQACKLICKTILEVNPFIKIKTKSKQTISRKDFTEEQIVSIFAIFDTIDLLYKEEMRILFMLGRWTGLRLGDCALLLKNDVNIKSGVLKITQNKTLNSIIIPIHPTLKEILKESFTSNTSEYVLPNVAKRYLSNPSGVYKDCTYIIHSSGLTTTVKPPRGIKRAINICEYGFHSFRHSFVSFCAKAGVPMAVVQAIVGHSSPAMTRHYTHIGVDTLRQAIEKL